MQPGESRANNAEPSDVKSPVTPRPRKQAFTANRSPAARLPSISGVGSGLGSWMTAGSLTSGVNLRFLFANSSRKQHDDAAISAASPLERPKSEVVSASCQKCCKSPRGPLKSGPTSSGYTPDIVHTALVASKPVRRPNYPIF